MKAPFKLPHFASLWSAILCATVFAALFAFIGNIEYWLPPLGVEFKRPSPITLRISSSVYLRTNAVKSEYTERWFPVRIGETIINKERFRFVEAYIKSKKDILARRLVSFFVAAFLLSYFLSQSIRFSWPGRRRYFKSELSCYFMLIVSLIGVKIFLIFTFLPFTLMPLASIAAISIFFLGRRIGVMMGIVAAFMAGMLLDVDLIALVFFLVQGLSVVPILKYYRRKKRFFTATMLITATGVIVIPALTIMLSGSADTNTIQSWRNSQIIAAVGGGIICYPMIWLLHSIIRAMLGIVSQTKLNELQELQHPLLKKLQQQAPATWEHSRAIANLAEEAASKIGADALLARVGAYFHDIGKAAAPEFFVENYSLDGMVGDGPHKNLAPEKSAELIIDHVVEGVKILRSNGLPESVVEFVYMHHGTNVVEYFWRKYNDIHKDLPEEDRLPRTHFTYPGIKPQSPEPAILMLADGVEAASRTLSEYTVDEIQKIVSHVVMVKILDGQIEDSGLSMENLKTVLKSFVDSVHFSHHSRIKYQWQKEKKEEKEKEPASVPAPGPPAPHKPAQPEPAHASRAADKTAEKEADGEGRSSIATPLPDAVQPPPPKKTETT